MKNIFGFPREVVWFLAIVILFIGFNFWLMGQVEHVVGNEVKARRPVLAAAAVPAGAYIPVIDRENDLLAPVAKVLSPEAYLSGRPPQQNTDDKEYGLPRTGKILTD